MTALGQLLAQHLDAVSSSDSPRGTWRFSSTLRDSDSLGAGELAQPVVLVMNPKSIKPQWPKRFARQDTLSGAVFHHFTDKDGRDNDIMSLSITGNSGNINAASVALEDEKQVCDRRLAVLHDLYNLTQERVLLEDGTANIFSITYDTPMFPFPVTFYGIWEKPMEYEESASKPNSRDYSLSFIVQATKPDMSIMLQTLLEVQSSGAIGVGETT